MDRVFINTLSDEQIKEIEERYIQLLEKDPRVIELTKYADYTIREGVESVGLGPYIKILEVRPLEDYKLWCRLSTDEVKIFDFTPLLEMPMCQPLKDKMVFDTVSAENGCLSWIEEDIDIGTSYVVLYGMDVQ